jgi:hypothetical protein
MNSDKTLREVEREMPIRVWNALLNAGFTRDSRLGDVMNMPHKTFLMIPNFGKKSYIWLKEFVTGEIYESEFLRKQREQKLARNKYIYEQRKAGRTLKNIGEELGVGAERVRQREGQYIRYLRRGGE